MNLILCLLIGIVTGHASIKLHRLSVKGGVTSAVALASFGAIEGIFLGNLLFDINIYTITFATVFFSLVGALLLLFIQQLCCRFDESGNIFTQ